MKKSSRLELLALQKVYNNEPSYCVFCSRVDCGAICCFPTLLLSSCWTRLVLGMGWARPGCSTPAMRYSQANRSYQKIVFPMAI